MTTSLCCALLVIIGLFLATGTRFSDLLDGITKPFQKDIERKKRIQRITKKKPNRFQRMANEAAEMLDASGYGEQLDVYRQLSIALAAMGFLFGLVMDNIAAAIVLGVSLAVLPTVFIRLRASDYKKLLHEKLEIAMSSVTNSYIAMGDLQLAVENVLHLLPEPADAIFRRYLTEMQYISGNHRQALEKLRDEVDLWHWKEWCNALIQCQEDKGLRYSLPALVERMSEQRQLTAEADAAMRRQMTDYMMIVLVVLGSIPLMGIMMPDWYDKLMYTVPGKITLAVVLAIILATLLWVSRAVIPTGIGEEDEE